MNAFFGDPEEAAAQTIGLVQAAGIRVIRLPGASMGYDWSTNKTYSAPGVLETWTRPTGFDKFSRLITGANLQAFVTVNYGSGTPEQAVAWVAYANAASTLQGTAADVPLGVDSYGVDWKTAGYWSSLRASAPLATDDGRNFLRLGRSGPFGLKYWEVGNECYGSWQTDYHAVPWDPVTYATIAATYIAKMKAVDPTIKTGVVAVPGEDTLFPSSPVHDVTNPRTGATHHGWTPVMLAMLKNLGVTPDFLIYHYYVYEPGQEDDATLLQAGGNWSSDAADLRQQLNDYLGSAAANVGLDVTENNSVSSSPGKQTTSLVNGLYLADSLGNLLQTEFNSLSWFNLRYWQDNGNNNSGSLYGWRLYGDYGILSSPSSFGSTTYYDAYPTYYVMKLFSHFARGGDTVVQATTDNPLVSIFAARRLDGSLSLLAINKSPTGTLTANVSLTGFTPLPTATVYSYGIPQDEAARTGSGSSDIAVSSQSLPGPAFTMSLAPYSATVFSLADASGAQTANLTVNATHPVRTVDQRHFGVNTVGWDWQTASSETVALVQAAGIGVIRFPGGTADVSDWSTDFDYSSAGVLDTTGTNAAGFDKFSRLMTGANTQAFITVNYGSGTPQQAAAWVAYANASSTLLGTASDVTLGVDSYGVDWKTAGYWSALRASTPLATDDGRNFLRLGLSSPFGLKDWEIGNENFGPWERDYHAVPNDAYTYASAFPGFWTLMKAVDPNIKIGIVILTGEDTYANSNGTTHAHPAVNPRTGVTHYGWGPVLLSTLKSLGVTPDFATYHRYEQAPGTEDDATLLMAAENGADYSGESWAADAAALRQELNDYLGSNASSVELLVGENNSVNTTPGKQITSLVNGLYYADSLGSLLQTEFNSLAWYALRNGPMIDGNGSIIPGNESPSLYGWRNYGDYGILSTPFPGTSPTSYYEAYPVYYAMKLVSHFARAGDTVVRATTDNPLLAVYAAKRLDGSLSVLVINKSPTSTFSANISLAGFIPFATATVYSYGIPQDNAAQTGSGSPDIATSSLGNAAPAFAVSFAPYSATVLSLQAPSRPAISIQPVSQTLTPGHNAVFSVTASGNPLPTYQWQRQASGTSTWTDLGENGAYTGTATATLTVNSVVAAMNGDSFRCVITNSNGTATTSQATLVVEHSADCRHARRVAGNQRQRRRLRFRRKIRESRRRRNRLRRQHLCRRYRQSYGADDHFSRSCDNPRRPGRSQRQRRRNKRRLVQSSRGRGGRQRRQRLCGRHQQQRSPEGDSQPGWSPPSPEGPEPAAAPTAPAQRPVSTVLPAWSRMRLETFMSRIP